MEIYGVQPDLENVIRVEVLPLVVRPRQPLHLGPPVTQVLSDVLLGQGVLRFLVRLCVRPTGRTVIGRYRPGGRIRLGGNFCEE